MKVKSSSAEKASKKLKTKCETKMKEDFNSLLNPPVTP